MKKILCAQGLPSSDGGEVVGYPTSVVTPTVLKKISGGDLDTVIEFDPQDPTIGDQITVGFLRDDVRYAELRALPDPHQPQWVGRVRMADALFLCCR